jgi:large subunit ribosomal protein L9
MEVLLRKDVEKLGKTGETVKVADGFARNYLLPRRLATPVTADNLQRLGADKRRAGREAVKQLASLREVAKQIEATSVTITAQANEAGHLFGSVAAAQIVEALEADHITIDEKTVRIEHPIKETGVYAIEIHLAPDAIATTRVWVVAE